jgi:DNA-binding PadR family transcriptional regulator
VAAVDLAETGVAEFHGYDLARRLGDIQERRLLTGYGTLYRTLGRLEKMGLLDSHWEDPAIPARENRPGRRLYAITGAGEDAARAARRANGARNEQGSLHEQGLLRKQGSF